MQIQEAIQNHTSFNEATLIAVSRQDRLSGLTLAATIPKNTIQINTGAFWKGRRRSGHKTSNTIPLYIHMKHDRPDEEVHTVSLVTRLRNTRTYTPDNLDPQHAIFTLPLPETPHSIHVGLYAGTDEDQLALRAGLTTRTQAEDLHTIWYTPSAALHTRQKHRTCMPPTHTQNLDP
jgi:hypothetical protein